MPCSLSRAAANYLRAKWIPLSVPSKAELGQLLSFTIEIPASEEEAKDSFCIAINGPVIVKPLVEYFIEEEESSQGDQPISQNDFTDLQQQPQGSNKNKDKENKLEKGTATVYPSKRQSKGGLFSIVSNRGKHTGILQSLNIQLYI